MSKHFIFFMDEYKYSPIRAFAINDNEDFSILINADIDLSGFIDYELPVHSGTSSAPYYLNTQLASIVNNSSFYVNTGGRSLRKFNFIEEFSNWQQDFSVFSESGFTIYDDNYLRGDFSFYSTTALHPSGMLYVNVSSDLLAIVTPSSYTELTGYYYWYGVFSESGEFYYASKQSQGIDVYSVDVNTNELIFLNTFDVGVSFGHLAIAANNKLLACTTNVETEDQVVIIDINPVAGTLTELARVSTGTTNIKGKVSSSPDMSRLFFADAADGYTTTVTGGNIISIDSSYNRLSFTEIQLPCRDIRESIWESNNSFFFTYRPDFSNSYVTKYIHDIDNSISDQVIESCSKVLIFDNMPERNLLFPVKYPIDQSFFYFPQ